MTRPIEIIAEAGINHNGDMEIARSLIQEAKRSGADVIKFQLYDPRKREDLEEHRFKDILLMSRLTRRQLYFLKAECDRINIEFMCSAFDVERVGWCEEIGVKRYKIASKSVYDEELVKTVIGTGKEVIVSDGMLKPDTVLLDALKDQAVKWLYCVSEYPTPFSHLDFYNKDTFIFYNSSIFAWGCYGFSDHTIGITASVVAMSLGARIIEKHFTLDKAKPGPDHILSIEPQELQTLCRFRDDIERILYENRS